LRLVDRPRCVVHRTTEGIEHATVLLRAGLVAQAIIELLRIGALQVGDAAHPEAAQVPGEGRADAGNRLQFVTATRPLHCNECRPTRLPALSMKWAKKPIPGGSAVLGSATRPPASLTRPSGSLRSVVERR